MTSQVVVLSLNGAAVASDTLLTVGRTRTIPSVRKIVDVGGAHRLLVCFSGNATLMNVPWQRILEEWSLSLGEVPLASLDSYCAHFRNWLPTRDDFLSDSHRRAAFTERIASVFDDIESISTARLSDLESSGEPTSENAAGILHDECRRILEMFETYEPFWGLGPEKAESEWLASLCQPIEELIEEIFEDWPVHDDTQAILLHQIPAACVYSSLLPTTNTELGFVGFGSEDPFSGIVRFHVHGLLGDRLQTSTPSPSGVSPDSETSVHWMAQGDAISTFIRGADPELSAAVSKALHKALLEHLPVDLAETRVMDEKGTSLFTRILDEVSEELDRQSRNFVDPLLGALETMPPAELANVARSLVQVQALRAHTAGSLPTVGGSIDAAFLTKHGGATWL